MPQPAATVGQGPNGTMIAGSGADDGAPCTGGSAAGGSSSAKN